jgi:hypothetical protein
VSDKVIRIMKMNNILAVVVGVGVCFLCGCSAPRATITEYGVFKAEAVQKVGAADTSLKHVVTLGGVTLVEQTESIVAKKGLRFGIRYRVKGADLEITVVTIKLRHPAMTNPKTRKTFTLEQWHQKPKADGLGYAGFTMDSDWEIVSGDWTFEVWADGSKLAEKSFSVTNQ